MSAQANDLAFRWPITSEYGWRTHPIYGNARYHSGIDIGGDYGMNIYAADSGTVTYSGWISGYGNTVIIDHGNGVSTLYGHNQSLTVSVGQNISQGDIIAHCGSTGNSTGLIVILKFVSMVNLLTHMTIYKY